MSFVRYWPPMSISRCASLVALASSIAGFPAFATQVVHFDTPGLVRGSSDIVIGRVEGTRSYWNDRHTKILTEVSVRVSESLKGVPPGELRLVQLGGEVDGMRYHVPGSPLFAPGEEALLFVWRDAAGRAQVNALAQGKFDIRRDPATGARLVQRPLPGLAIAEARTLRAAPAGRAAPGVPLEDLLSEIRRALAEDGR